MHNLRPKRPDLRLKRPDLGPERPNGDTNGQMGLERAY